MSCLERKKQVQVLASCALQRRNQRQFKGKGYLVFFYNELGQTTTADSKQCLSKQKIGCKAEYNCNLKEFYKTQLEIRLKINILMQLAFDVELKQGRRQTATRTPQNNRFNEQNYNSARLARAFYMLLHFCSFLFKRTT